MQSKSATYNTILADENHFFEVKLNINGTDYGQDVIYGAKSDCKVFDTAPTIGGTYSGTLEFSLLGDGSAIPKMASVKPYFRAVLGATTSEWIQKGEFFIDTRSVSHNDNGLTVFSAHCFDAMLKANANYATSSLAWPATDTAVVAEIASKIGVSQDSRNSAILTGGYSIPLPTEYTMRDVLSFIAAMYAANWIITDEGKLRIVPIAGGADTLAVGKSCANLDISTSRSAYTKVIYEIDDETVVESGSTDTNVMEVYNPFGTQTEADAVYTILSAWSYKPFDASGVWSDPCVEVGDQITAVGESGTIYSRSITFGPGMVMELSAPNDNYVDHEYEYESPEERRYTRTVSGLSSSISLNASGIQLVSQKLDDIGGRNYVWALSKSIHDEVVYTNASVAYDEAKNGEYVVTTTTASGQPNTSFPPLVIPVPPELIGETMIFHADYISASGTNNARVYIRQIRSMGNVTAQSYLAPGTLSTEITIRSDAAYLLPVIYVRYSGTNTVGESVTVRGLKLERGTVATDWTPAPEDAVNGGNVISKINVSPESIVIAANKVDLQGYVQFTNLSTSGQTTINGANIVTGLIQDAQGKNSWNLDTGALTITDGTINITTSSAYDDLIQLKSGNYAVSIQPQAVTAANSGNFASLTQLGLRMERNPATVVGILNAGSFNVIDGSTYNDRLLLDYSSGLTFYNSSGTITATYPATGLPMLNGAADSTTQSGAVIAVPYVTHSTLGISSSATDFEVSKAWAAYVAAQYPNKEYCVFIGTVSAGSVRNAQMMAYKTNNTNADGIPQYCNVQLSRYSGGIFYYTCDNGTYSRVAFLDQSSLRFLDSNGYSTASYPATSNQLSPTYITNPYCSSTSVERVWIRRQGSFGFLHFNLSIDTTSLTSSAGFVQIMSFSGVTLKQDEYCTVASQSGQSTLLMQILWNGTVQIYTSYGSASGFYRVEMPLIFA